MTISPHMALNNNDDHQVKFTAIVLAGARPVNHENPARDELRIQEGEDLKAFIKLSGTAMIDYVLKALKLSNYIDDIYVSMDDHIHDAPIDFKSKAPLLADMIEKGEAHLIDTCPGPSQSVEKILDMIPADKPVMVTTADHPLLTRAILREFLQKSVREAEKSSKDATLAVVSTDIIEHAYPKNKRTRLAFRDGGYTGCNLFALMTPQSRKIPAYWQNIEQMRKQPIKMASHLGWGVLMQYGVGLLTLDKAMMHISRKSDISLHAIRMHQAEAGIDVDKPSDLALVRDIIQNY